MKINRNDIVVGILANGDLYVAQGNPAIEELMNMNPVDTTERIYYSQLYYRVGYRTADGNYHVGTNTDAKNNSAIKTVNAFNRYAHMTSAPARIGSVA